MVPRRIFKFQRRVQRTEPNDITVEALGLDPTTTTFGIGLVKFESLCVLPVRMLGRYPIIVVDFCSEMFRDQRGTDFQGYSLAKVHQRCIKGDPRQPYPFPYKNLLLNLFEVIKKLIV